MLTSESPALYNDNTVTLAPSDICYAKRKAYRMFLDANPDRVGRGFNALASDEVFESWVFNTLMPRVEQMMEEALAHAPKGSRYDRAPRGTRPRVTVDRPTHAIVQKLSNALAKAFEGQPNPLETYAQSVADRQPSSDGLVRVAYCPAYGAAGRALNEQTLAQSKNPEAMLGLWANTAFEKAAQHIHDPVLLLAATDRCVMGRKAVGRPMQNNAATRAVTAELGKMFMVPRGAGAVLDPAIRKLYADYVVLASNAPIVLGRWADGVKLDPAATTRMYVSCRKELAERAKKFIAVTRGVIAKEFGN